MICSVVSLDRSRLWCAEVIHVTVTLTRNQTSFVHMESIYTV